MQVKSIAECSKREHSAILRTFIKLPFVIKTYVLSIFKWPLKTGFTVHYNFLKTHLWNARLMTYSSLFMYDQLLDTNRGSYMSAHVLLNVLNKLRKSDKMPGLPSILSLSQQV